MPDKTYCYPNSDVLINKLNIRNQADLFEAEKELTYIRLKELQDHPIKGEFARLICMECGYAFDLSVTTHEEMLRASKISFDKGDNQR